MTWARLLIALLVPALCGYLIVSSMQAQERMGFFEKLSLGFGAGVGLIALETFVLGVFGLSFSAPLIAVILALLTSPFVVLRYMNPVRPAPEQPTPAGVEKGGLKSAIIVIILLWLAFKAGFVLFEGLYRPIISNDAWWNWSSGAKVFFYARGLLLEPGSEHFFGLGYRPFLSYPLLNPLAQVWISLVLGDFHEALSKAWAPVYYLGMLSIVYFAVRKEGGGGGRFPALLTTFFLSAAPLLTFHTLDAYSDLPLAFYVLSGSVMLWQYMEEDGYGRLVLSGLFFSMGAFTKNEGLVYISAGLVALLAFNVIEGKKRWAGLFYYAAPAALYIAPWLLFKAYYGIGYGHGTGTGVGFGDVAGGITWAPELHPEVIGIFLKEIFLTVNHGLVFPFLAVVTVLGYRIVLGTNVKYLYLIVLVIAAVLLFFYIATNDYTYVLSRAAVNRNALTFLPLSFLIAGIVTTRVLRKK